MLCTWCVRVQFQTWHVVYVSCACSVTDVRVVYVHVHAQLLTCMLCMWCACSVTDVRVVYMRVRAHLQTCMHVVRVFSCRRACMLCACSVADVRAPDAGAAPDAAPRDHESPSRPDGAAETVDGSHRSPG